MNPKNYLKNYLKKSVFLTIWNGNLVCGEIKVIWIWNSNRECIMELKGHTNFISCLVEWNEFLVSGSEYETIRI